MHTQSEILADLHAISDEIPCRPVAVPNHRPIPHVALWTGIPPQDIVSAQLAQPTRGAYIDPANERVQRNFTLDPRDPKTPDGGGAAGLRARRREPLLGALRELLKKVDRAPSLEVGLQAPTASLTPVGRPRIAHR